MLTPQVIAGGRGYDVEEIDDFRRWMNNDTPTAFTVGAQLTSARSNTSGTSVLLQSFSLNNWHTVKVVADVSTDKFDIYVDGVQRADDATFASSASALDNIYFTTSNSTGSASYTQYIDGVSITK